MKDSNPLTAEMSAVASRLIRETALGSLIFVVQDSRVVQIERNEKFQFPAKEKTSSARLHSVKSTVSDPLPGIQASLDDLQFGQVVVKIQEGRVVQMDRTEKRRLPDLMGLSGDGI